MNVLFLLSPGPADSASADQRRCIQAVHGGDEGPAVRVCHLYSLTSALQPGIQLEIYCFNFVALFEVKSV